MIYEIFIKNNAWLTILNGLFVTVEISAFSLISSPQACMAIIFSLLSKSKGRVVVFHKSEKAGKMCFQSEEGTDLSAP